MDDRPRPRPVPDRFDGKAGEQLAPSLEQRLERGDEKRLAEPPRTGEEELLADRQVHQRQEKPRLVDVGETRPAQVLEREDVSRNLFHTPYYTT